MHVAAFAALGLLVGAVAGAVLVILWRRREAATAGRLNEQAQREKAQELAALVEQLKITFTALSREALSQNADDFLKLAKTRFAQQAAAGEQLLEAKKKLIDARLEEMGVKLSNLNTLMQTLERERARAQGSLAGQIEKATQATNRLHETTFQLREALAHPQRRGRWGERMAEDVLRLAGFIEGVNYMKQQSAGDGSRPDFTFRLPGNRQLHMDVKFPLANYLKMLDAPDEAARETCTAQFLKDVRARIKEVTTRSYIDPAGGTVDYVLVFIPNEQVYGFIHERDSSLLDDAMRSKVVLCAPMTLYAILAVMRQAMDQLHLEQSSRHILELLAEFKKQWCKFADGMDKMGDRLEAAQKEYQNLIGVRTRRLERQLDKIEDLRAARGDAAAPRSLDEPPAPRPHPDEVGPG